MSNPNHPKKGDLTKVDPIRDTRDIKNIKRLLSDKPRDLAIFVIGINTNLRASDLLKIKVGQVRQLIAGEHFSIREKKTQKLKDITINVSVAKVIQNLLATMSDTTDDAFLFQSRKGGGMISVGSLHSMVQSWGKECNVKAKLGSHSLRKTFGFIHRTVFGTDIPTLMIMFNHSTQRQTLTYLGIQAEEVKDAYLKEI